MCVWVGGWVWVWVWVCGCGCGCVGGCVGVSVLMFVGVWVDVGEMLSYGGTSWGYCG